jgi:predicted RNA-binding protein YlqC (UPF0109 family)
MEEKHVDQEFLEYLIKSIVDHPDDVKIERTIDDLGVLLRLQVHKEDMGQVVGRQGATAKAVRSLLRIVGIKNNARVNLKIEEPEGSTHVQAPRAPAAPQAGGSFSPSHAHNDFAPQPVKKFEGPVADDLGL